MVTAEDVLATVRVHADRVHDLVRRLGCGPAAALQIVEQSALQLVAGQAVEPAASDEVAGYPAGPATQADPTAAADPVGWWFTRARDLARSSAGARDEIPTSAGVLSTDAGQARLAGALDARPEAERVPLLLRDAYDLPATSVGRVLGLAPDEAMTVVGQARLALLPSLAGGQAAVLDSHTTDPAGLARLAEGGQVATRDATLRRHVQSCQRCGAVVGDQERARRLLRALVVTALPAAAREQLLAAVTALARDVLPSAPRPAANLPAGAVLTGAVLTDAEQSGAPGRRRALSGTVLSVGLLLAVAVGLLIGFVLSRSPTATAPSANDLLPSQSVDPVRTLPAVPTVTGAPPAATARPTTSVFTITPTPAPTTARTKPPVATTAPPPTVIAEPLSLALAPASGPNGTVVQVTGRGWTPGATVTVDYRDVLGRTTGAGADAVVDARGRFTTSLTADDPANLPGRHTVQARDGTHSARAVFSSTG